MERSKKPSEIQKDALIEFMETNMDMEMSSDLIKSVGGASQRHEKWKQLANHLNSLGGAQKDAQRWRKYWTDQKLYVKEKLTLLDAGTVRSGRIKQLTLFESRICALIQPNTKIETTDTFDNHKLSEQCMTDEQMEDGDFNNTQESEISTKSKESLQDCTINERKSNEDILIKRIKLKYQRKMYELELRKFEWQMTKEKRELELKEKEFELRKAEIEVRKKLLTFLC